MSDTDKHRLLTAVRETSTTADEKIAALKRDVAESIRDARTAGASWADIGVALGVTRQAACQRYGPAVEALR